MRVKVKMSGREMSFEIEESIEVEPMTIDYSFFTKCLYFGAAGEAQEMILKAFEVLKVNPQRYARKFRVIVPKKTWNAQTIKGLKDFADKNGSHMTDWVEMALAWAQALVKGKYTWNSLILELDTPNWYKLFVRENGLVGRVGGFLERDEDDCPESMIDQHFVVSDDDVIITSVPLITVYE